MPSKNLLICATAAASLVTIAFVAYKVAYGDEEKEKVAGTEGKEENQP